MIPRWLRNLRERVAAMSPLRRAAVTFVYMFVSGIIVMPLAYRLLDYFAPGNPLTRWQIVVLAACDALLFSVLVYFGIM